MATQAVGLSMMEMLSSLVDSHGFIPHGHCYLWKPGLVWLHVFADGLIALAYFSIPFMLIYFISKRRDIPFNQVFFLFGAFIIACGSGHLMDIVTLWQPIYWASGVLKAITALISIYTALALLPLIPQALSLPSPAQLEQANQELQETLDKLQRAQSQLVQTEKLSSLGQLVAGVAHEINNPINFIHGNLEYIGEYSRNLLSALQLYQSAYSQPDLALAQAVEDYDLEFIAADLPKILTSVEVGTERIRQIVLSLRNFSRLDEAAVKSVNIHEGIDSTLMILQHQLKSDSEKAAIAVHKNYGDLPPVECFAGQLNQVFMNLLSNAIDGLERRRSYYFAYQKTAEQVEASRPEMASIWITTELLNHHAVIKIADNGSGIAEADQKRLFSPFFTTKPVGRGTGLGLSISQQIVVEKHRGKLECSSQPGVGTTFTITLPIQVSVDSNHCQISPLVAVN